MQPGFPVMSASMRRRCASCDYDLSGAPPCDDARCPECGQDQSPIALARAREARFFRDVRGLAMILLLPALAIPIGGVAALGASSLVYFLPALFLALAAVPYALGALATARMPDDAAGAPG